MGSGRNPYWSDCSLWYGFSYASGAGLKNAYDRLYETIPTAVNLRWELDNLNSLPEPLPADQHRNAAYKRALEIADADLEMCSNIGDYGKELIEVAWFKKGKPSLEQGGCLLFKTSKQTVNPGKDFGPYGFPKATT